MTPEEFEAIVSEEFPEAIPLQFRNKIRNLAFVIEDEPSSAVRTAQRLKDSETLLGLYHGVPLIARGDSYGIGAVTPDIITLYRAPILSAARSDPARVRSIVRDTIWHEVAHYFGIDHAGISRRKAARARKPS